MRQIMIPLAKSRLVCAALLAQLLCWTAAPARAQNEPAGAETMRRVDRFTGSAKLSGKGGASKNVQLSLRQISLPGKQTFDVPLDPGFHVITLRAGKVVTVVDGKEERRDTGDIWSVKEKARMSVTVSGEAAVLEVMSFVVR